MEGNMHIYGNMEGLSEFLLFPNKAQIETMDSQTNSRPEIWNWTVNQTKLLLDLYKKYKSKVGTSNIRTLKRLWEILSEELNAILKTKITPSQCENRWRVLERTYKKYIDNQNKTGQSRKYFEYVNEMNEIFKGKKNIKPVLLLSPTTIDNISKNELEINLEADNTASTSDIPKSEKISLINTPIRTKRKITNPILNRNILLQNMRDDRRQYYKEKLKVDREKLDLQKKKLEAIEARNLLLKERNELLLKHNKCT